jgi:hypothetical protein
VLSGIRPLPGGTGGQLHQTRLLESERVRGCQEGDEYHKTAVEQSDTTILNTVKNVGETIGKATRGIRETRKDIFKNL